jgi:hypothetical protein
MKTLTTRRLVQPRYPIYIPSKGRASSCLTARCLDRDRTPYMLVVEPQEHVAYAKTFGHERVLTLPFSNRKTSTPARNWIKEHATRAGHVRHWQLDDNIRVGYRLWKSTRVRCRMGIGLAVCEDFADRYENVAVAGLTYRTFCIPTTPMPPFYLNVHVYSCSLVLNALPHRWRPKYNEDTDFCLQVLADGWCTVLINAFCIDKVATMTMRGGNGAIYQGDGRLQMARSLERSWPGVVSVRRRFQRPQHVIRDHWRKFDTPLQRKSGVVITKRIDEYGMTLVERGVR